MQKGFTLIELLVVIAIIGILASIVLVFTSEARNKGKDANIKQDLTAIRNQAGIYYDDTGSFGASFGQAMCPTSGSSMFYDSPQIRGLIADVKIYVAASDVICASNGSSWAVSAKLKTTGMGHWCVDANGASEERPTAITGTSC